MRQFQSKHTIIGLLALTFIATAYYLWTWSDVLAHFGGDNAYYLLTANYLSPYSSANPVASYYSGISQYPPLYPLLLALSGGGESLLMAHIVTTTCLLFSLVVIYGLANSEGMSRWQSLGVSTFFALLPGTYIQALSIHSENLYTLTSLLGLMFISLYEKSEKPPYLLAAATMIACASLVRTAGIALVIAFIIYLFLREAKQKYRYMVIVILPIIIWLAFQSDNETSYLAALSGFYSNDFLQILTAHLTSQTHYVLNAWTSSFTTGIFGTELLYALLLVCITSALYRTYRKKIDGLYVILYLCMIIIWPYPAESIRLLLPIMPILLIQTGILVMQTSLKCNIKHSYAFVFAGSIFFAITLPDLLLSANRFNSDLDPSLSRYKHSYSWYIPSLNTAKQSLKLNRAITESLVNYRKYVPENECVFSIKPSILGLYMQRLSSPSPPQGTDRRSIHQCAVAKSLWLYTVNVPAKP